MLKINDFRVLLRLWSSLANSPDFSLENHRLIRKLQNFSYEMYYLESSGKVRDLKSGDIKPDPDIEILDPDIFIMTVNNTANVKLEARVRMGRGYVQADENFEEDLDIEYIPVDSIHSPVRKVDFKVEAARLGQLTDYDELNLDVWTNGCVTPQDAVAQAASILKDQLYIFINYNDQEDIEEPEPEEEEPETPSKTLWSLVKGYGPALRPHLLMIFVALLGSTAVGGAFSAEAVIFGNTVGSLNPCKSADSIRSRGEFYGLMFFVLAIIEFFANLISWAGFGWVSEKTVYSVRVLSFRSLMEQDLQWHQSKGRTPAMLLSYITRDGNALAGLSGSVVGTLFSITVNLIAAIALMRTQAMRTFRMDSFPGRLLVGNEGRHLRDRRGGHGEGAPASAHSVSRPAKPIISHKVKKKI